MAGVKPYGYKIGADSNWGVGKQSNAIKGRARLESRESVQEELVQMDTENTPYMGPEE